VGGLAGADVVHGLFRRPVRDVSGHCDEDHPRPLAPAEGYDFHSLPGDLGKVLISTGGQHLGRPGPQTRGTGRGQHGFDAPARSVTVSHDQ